MDNYEDELFKFITREQNFESAYDISEQFPKIKDRILCEFWNLVAKDLRESLKVMDLIHNWEVEYESNIYKKNSKFIIRLSDWENFYLCFEPLYDSSVRVGLWMNFHSGKIQREKMNNIIKASNSNEFGIIDLPWWLYQEDLNCNFSTLNGLIKILPENRTELVSLFSEKIKTLLGRNEDLIVQLQKLSY